MSMTVEEILTKAVELGKMHGVSYGHFHDSDGSMCINGLMVAAFLGRPTRDSVEYRYTMNRFMKPTVSVVLDSMDPKSFEPVYDVLPRAVVDRFDEITWNRLAIWNNRFARDGEVIALLERALASVKSKRPASTRVMETA